MADSEEERPFKARPQSVIAQNFSLALDNAFGLDGTFELTQTVQDKKLAVNTQNAELEALEARLRAAEERLKAKGGKVPNACPSRSTSATSTSGQQINHSPRAGNTQNSCLNTVNRPGAASKQQPPVARKPAVPQEESDEEEEPSEEEDSETEESSEEEVRRK